MRPLQKMNQIWASMDMRKRGLRDSLMLMLMIGLLSALMPVLSADLSVPAASNLEYSGRALWDESAKSLTFTTSGGFPPTKEGFYWMVPSGVRRIVIGRDVMVTGGLRVGYREPSNPLRIEGIDRDSSVIFGTPEKQWTSENQIPENEKWKYGAISVLADARVYVSNLTSRNPRSYHVSGYANRSVIHMDQCSLFDTRGGDNNNSDGFIGSAGSSIKNSLIDTLDDGIKIYHDIEIENVTIRQHRNGAAIQLGWGGEGGEAKASIRNLTIIGGNPEQLYNMAPFSWEAGTNESRHISIDGLKVRFTGRIFNEASGEWDPASLFEIKSGECLLNIEAINVDLGGLDPNLRHARGVVHIESTVPEISSPERTDGKGDL